MPGLLAFHINKKIPKQYCNILFLPTINFIRYDLLKYSMPTNYINSKIDLATIIKKNIYEPNREKKALKLK